MLMCSVQVAVQAGCSHLLTVWGSSDFYCYFFSRSFRICYQPQWFSPVCMNWISSGESHQPPSLSAFPAYGVLYIIDTAKTPNEEPKPAALQSVVSSAGLTRV